MPAAQPGSWRRLTCLDLVRPHGPAGDLTVRGRALDVTTDSGGRPVSYDDARLEATVDYHGGRVLLHLETSPELPELAALVGASVIAGFRGRADLDTVAGISAPLAALLDDLPVGVLISGHAVSAARTSGNESVTVSSGYIPVADQCAGYAAGGALMTAIAERGRSPVADGPDAPALDAPEWMSEPLAEHGMRRIRRIDRHHMDGAIRVDAMFRDTYRRVDGVETVIHEYELAVVADEATGVIEHAVATPRVLPWFDCPGAVASAGTLVGTTLERIDERVRRDFRGVGTCTHLNDLLRSIGR